MSFIQPSVQTNAIILLNESQDQILVEDSGKIIMIPQTTTQDIEFDLPSPQLGLHYRITNGLLVGLTHNVLITTFNSNDIINGTVLCGPNGGVLFIDVLDSHSIIFTTDTTVGDYIDLYSNGVSWFISGMARDVNGISAI